MLSASNVTEAVEELFNMLSDTPRPEDLIQLEARAEEAQLPPNGKPLTVWDLRALPRRYFFELLRQVRFKL